ncbi:hypothetical protein HRG_010628 [Hirsutella rhossiliensis]|uniref:Uncharacterized protein n=1 Tax=Hirsutella rhossiliensis TaxID=111463 RepID=A0A9P8MNQ7_9HYPO|nr:uncharacterized protein HRG_10628 [Hirsutella rhossiliensis]KAH0958327.1 hypothetical protein HRG_10628 [Hirsutella rhossiliensis]
MDTVRVGLMTLLEDHGDMSTRFQTYVTWNELHQLLNRRFPRSTGDWATDIEQREPNLLAKQRTNRFKHKKPRHRRSRASKRLQKDEAPQSSCATGLEEAPTTTDPETGRNGVASTSLAVILHFPEDHGTEPTRNGHGRLYANVQKCKPTTEELVAAISNARVTVALQTNGVQNENMPAADWELGGRVCEIASENGPSFFKGRTLSAGGFDAF